ncbi:MAG: LuxR family transcriptional regulator [Rhizobiaceae bacterium]|nr:LuxR family transcriptional regulator [Rhizobiaceae bacterium]
MQVLDLVDRIYEAAALPELWPSVFDSIGDLCACDKVGMFALSAARQNVTAWTANERGHLAMHAFLEGGWAGRSSQAARMFGLGEPRFVGDLDVFTSEELETDFYYQEFLKPHGLFWGAGTFVDGPADNKIIVTVHRPYEQGPLDPSMIAQLTALRPHIARSAFLATQFRLEHMRGALDALTRVGLPAATLAGRGRLMLANSLFEDLLATVFLDRSDRLRVNDRTVDRLLAEAIAAGDSVRGRTMALKDVEGRASHVLHVLPLPGHARDLFSGTEWLLVAVPVQADAVRLGVLEGLFDLTPSEARVARDLMAGLTVAQAAAAAAVSTETVRTQLKGVYRKTGINRQTELIRLLLAVSMGDQESPGRANRNPETKA